MRKEYNHASIRCEQFDQTISQSMFDRLRRWESEVLLGLCRSVLVDPMTRFFNESPKGFKLIDHPRRTVFIRTKKPERKRIVSSYSNAINSLIFMHSEEGFKTLKSQAKKKYTEGGF